MMVLAADLEHLFSDYLLFYAVDFQLESIGFYSKL
jgi:hypothetical protein